MSTISFANHLQIFQLKVQVSVADGSSLSFRPVIVRHTGAVCFAKFFPHQGLPGIDLYLQHEWQGKDHGNTVKMQTKAERFAAEHKWDVGKSTIDILILKVRLYFTSSTKKMNNSIVVH